MRTVRWVLAFTLTLLFLTGIETGLSAQEQKITVNVKKAKMSSVLKRIEDQTGLAFFYNNADLEDAKAVTLSVKDTPLRTVLETLLPDFEIVYKNKTIVLLRNSVSAERLFFTDSARKKISGSIKDEQGNPLAGASVVLDANGKKIWTVADRDGRFQLNPPDGLAVGDIISFSFLGFDERREIVRNKSVFNVTLHEKESHLQESVVIGYGSVNKDDLTGSVVSLDSSDIESSPFVSVDMALQGHIPGADIMYTDGEPGSTASIRIRGTRSITASNEPLIVVDGIMDAVHDLNEINMSDIASVSVLKDASSTAIYGSRGANGVVIITTKNGSSSVEKERIVLNTTLGVSRLLSKLDIMDASEFAQYWNDVAYFGADPDHPKNGNSYEIVYDDPESLGKGTDWIEEITRTGFVQKHSLSASGKSGLSSHYASFSYNDIQGIVKGSGQKRFTGRISLDRQLFKWLKLSYSGSYVWRNTEVNKVNIGGINYATGAMYLSPLMKTEDNINPLYYYSGKINNPVALIENNTDYKINNSTDHSFTVAVKLSDNLSFKSLFSYYVYQNHAYKYYPGSLPAKAENEGGEAYRSETDENSESSENTVSYHVSTGSHSFDLLGGFSSYRNMYHYLRLSGQGYMDDEVKWNNMNAVLDKNTYSSYSDMIKKTKMSCFARMNYNYQGQYLLTLTGRVDRSSNFASNRKSAFFPSAAFRWNVDKEKFFEGCDWMNALSVRLSAGLSGNDAIDAYRSLAALKSTTDGYLFDGAQPVAFYRSRLSSPDLSWEKTGSVNAGVDIAVLQDRINVTVETYKTSTSDLLLYVRTPAQTGYSSVLTNLGSTSNKGIELSLKTRNIAKKDFSWTTVFNLSHNDQIVNDIGTEEYVSVFDSPGNNPYMMYGYVKGYPLNSLWGFKYAGVWKNQKEVERNKSTNTYVCQSTSNGSARYYDINHDGILNREDLVYQGSSDPYLYGGIRNVFNYKNLSFGFFWVYSLGGKIYNYSEFYMSGSIYSNQYRYMLDAWHPTRNPDSDIPHPGSKSDAALPSDFMIHDASYLRLRSAFLTYKIDLRKTRLNLQNISFSLTGDNLLLFKKYNGFDPDVSSYGTSSTLRRVDLGAYPKASTVSVEIQLVY